MRLRGFSNPPFRTKFQSVRSLPQSVTFSLIAPSCRMGGTSLRVHRHRTCVTHNFGPPAVQPDQYQQGSQWSRTQSAGNIESELRTFASLGKLSQLDLSHHATLRAIADEPRITVQRERYLWSFHSFHR